MIRHYRRFPAFSATAVILGVILYLTLWPSPLPDDTPSFFEGADKVVHFGMFGALCFVALVDLSILRHRAAGWTAGALVALVTALAGGVIELLQHAMNLGRSAEWLDLVADTLGAVVALVVFRLLAAHHR